jgi:hypothetical protein
LHSQAYDRCSERSEHNITTRPTCFHPDHIQGVPSHLSRNYHRCYIPDKQNQCKKIFRCCIRFFSFKVFCCNGSFLQVTTSCNCLHLSHLARSLVLFCI